MFCGNCGSKAVEGNRFCIKCGREQSPTSASQSLAVPLLRGPEPAEIARAVTVDSSPPLVDRTASAAVTLAAPAERPVYCRHSPAQRSALGRDGSETCLGCGLPYAPGSPGSGVRLTIKPTATLAAPAERPVYCRHSPAQRSALGRDGQHGSEICMDCRLPYAPGSPGSGLRLAATGTDQPQEISPSAYRPQSHAGSVQHGMSFQQAVKVGLTKYFDFSSRARRSEFWWFELFFFIAYFGAGTLDVAFNSSGVLFGLTFLGLYLPMLAVTVRRLHDTNRSGWFVLIQAIPLVGGIIVLVFLCEDSGGGPNLYGPSPKPKDL